MRDPELLTEADQGGPALSGGRAGIPAEPNIEGNPDRPQSLPIGVNNGIVEPEPLGAAMGTDLGRG